MVRIDWNKYEIKIEEGEITTNAFASVLQLCRLVAAQAPTGPSEPHPDRAIAEAIIDEMGGRIVEDTGPATSDDPPGTIY